MTDDSTGEPADSIDPATVRQFLDEADGAFAEYDRGYADADATLRLLRGHIDDLRAAVEETGEG